MKRLVSFLGLGREGVGYERTTYVLDGRAVETTYVARALAELLAVDELVVLATPKSRDKSWPGLQAELVAAGLPAPDEPVLLEAATDPTSASAASLASEASPGPADERSLWRQFELLKAHLRAGPADEVVLDITHGFRSQPFFAAACVSFVRSVDPEPARHRVVYGAFEARIGGRTPIWELTPFVDLVDWARGLVLLLRTGWAEDVVAPMHELGASLAREWAAAGRVGRRPELSRLARALEQFGRDLVTVRTGALVLGRGSAQALLEAIEGAREDVAYLPALADVLDRVEAMAALLPAESLQSLEGRRALFALADLYARMGRLAEAVATVREAWVTRFAAPAAARPGKGFSDSARREAENAWHDRQPKVARVVSQVRNDLEHAGYRSNPAGAARLAEQVRELVDGLEATLGDSASNAPTGEPLTFPAVLVNLSNHPSDGWSAEQRAAAVALAPTLVDLPFPPVPPEAELGDVLELAENVLTNLPDGTTHALVQGEFVLATTLVAHLQDRGITCVSATTDRLVAQEGDEKRSRFVFVRLREYPRLLLVPTEGTTDDP